MAFKEVCRRGTMEGEPGEANGHARGHLFSEARGVEITLIALLAFIPATLVADAVSASPEAVFVLAALAIVPLSALLGRATEEYAVQKGPALGGFLNATLGNATELIIALFAIYAGLFDVVKASIAGSIIANLLLVFGAAVLAGGLRSPTLKLHGHQTHTALSLMTLSVIAIAMPALFYYSSLSPAVVQTQANPLTPEEATVRLHALTLWTAAVMLLVYAAGLLYSFVTHKHLFHASAASDKPVWSSGKAASLMVLATIGIAGMAEALVGSVHGLTQTLGLTELFVGVVIVAIVGNAAEHSTAIIVALRGKMELAFQIAAGSSTQIALLVTPVLIFVSFAIGTPMDMVFEIFELFGIAVAVVVAYAVTLDRETNWFEGVLLLGVYVVICAVFFVHP